MANTHLSKAEGEDWSPSGGQAGGCATEPFGEQVEMQIEKQNDLKTGDEGSFEKIITEHWI